MPHPMSALLQRIAGRDRGITSKQFAEVFADDDFGRHVSAQKQIDESIVEIKNQSRLVEQAGADLLAFIARPQEESSKE